jgi:hypothetical protein
MRLRLHVMNIGLLIQQEVQEGKEEQEAIEVGGKVPICSANQSSLVFDTAAPISKKFITR